jgi:hypothetical protein
MIRRLTVLVAATLLALILAAPAALAGGATQISGVGVFDDPLDPECNDPGVEGPGGEDPDYALVMSGALEGCLYTFVDPDPAVSPSGTYRETGTELFVGSWGGETGTFRTTYRFEAKYEDVDNLAGEIFGRCQHPIVEGSGTGVFEGVSGQLFFKDDVETGEFFYRGHLRY